MSHFISPDRTGIISVRDPSTPNVVAPWLRSALGHLPGIGLLALLALTGHAIGRGGPLSVLDTILLGIVLRSSFGLGAWFEPGTRLYELFWKVGIVFLGSQIELRNFREVGVVGLGLAALEIIAAMALVVWLSRILSVEGPVRYLLAAGTGICGVSAVVALSAMVHADEEDTSYAIAVILLFGVLTLGLLPFIGHALGLSDVHFGLWSGYAVNNTAEAVATGFVFSETAGHYATLTKLSRNIFLSVVVLYFAPGLWRGGGADNVRAKIVALARSFPKFTLGMLVFSLLATVHYWSNQALRDLTNAYHWIFLLGFAGVGLRTDLTLLLKRGLKPLLLTAGVQVLMASLMLGSVLWIFR
jgi:uncharacterized integral membrane protein (TIGR00698 family)